jgi:4-alpha-glucanotransferase
LVAWWATLSDEDRRAVVELLPPDRPEASPSGGEEAETVRWELLERLYQARSRYVILPVQDLFGWAQRINLPATTGPENWTFRLPVPIEDLGQRAGRGEATERLRASIDRAGRLRTMS